jgi:hypothetical protein
MSETTEALELEIDEFSLAVVSFLVDVCRKNSPIHVLMNAEKKDPQKFATLNFPLQCGKNKI